MHQLHSFAENILKIPGYRMTRSSAYTVETVSIEVGDEMQIVNHRLKTDCVNCKANICKERYAQSSFND